MSDRVHKFVFDNIDNLELFDTIIELKDKHLNGIIAGSKTHFSSTAPATTKHYDKYNVLTYPDKNLYTLYKNIIKVFNSIKNTDRIYYIQSWVNIYYQGDFIDWHHHWKDGINSFHGFYCVNVDNSITEYKWKDGYHEKVVGQDGLIAINESGKDMHRTYPWKKSKPRVTVAFDLVPYDEITWEKINHWIPAI